MARDFRQKKEVKLFVNDQIKAPNMLVLGNAGEKIWLFPRRKVQEMSQQKWLDIIQLHYDFDKKVATVKLVDLWKYLYEKQKLEKEKKKTQKKPLKQIKFGYSIGDNDLQLKIKKATEFLKEWFPVKISVRLRGREKIYADRVYDRLLVIKDDLSEISRSQYDKPKQEASGYAIILLPKGK